MAFGYYKIGANTPADVYCPPAPKSVQEARDKSLGVYALAADAPRVVDSTMKVSNFFTGQKQGSVMGYYKQGADISGSPLGATPAFFRSEMLRVLSEATSLGKDIEDANKEACALPGEGRDFTETGDSKCAKLNRFVNNTWSPFLKELHAFVNRHESWSSRLWSSVYTDTQEYRKKLIALRSQAIIFGVGVTAPAPVIPPDYSFFKEIGGTIRTILYILVGGFMVWILFKIAAPMLKGATA